MNDIAERLRRLSLLRLKRMGQVWRRRISAECDRELTFVSGVQRSGTNLVMDILERSWETDVFHESDPRAFDNYIMRDVSVIRRLVEASPSRRVVVKALCEASDLTRLMQLFAPARAIWMYRRYDDMINSNRVAWPGGRNQIDAIVKDRASGGWRGMGMTDETHAVVREHYRPDMNDASALALFWYYRNQLFFDQGFERNDRVMLMQYESLVTDPVKRVASITRFVDVACRPSMSVMISRGSIGKKSPPEIDDRIRTLCDAMLARLDVVWKARWADYA